MAVALATWPAALLTALGGATGRATEAYYMVVFAAQEANNPVTSHCFATFARLTGAGGSGGESRVELHHINWFSLRGHQTGSTRGLVEADGRPTRPEPGANRTTREALLLAHRWGLRVTRWGPYEIDRGLFERALRQIDLLEGRVPGRRVLYKAIDLGWRDGQEVKALNCIHAISDVDAEPAPLRTWTSYGAGASRRVIVHLGRWIKDRGQDHPEVWGAIWEATWRDVPAPSRLDVVREEPPWKPRAAPSRAIRTVARSGFETGAQPGRDEDGSMGGGD